MERRNQARVLVAAALADVEAELAQPSQDLCPTQLGTCRDTLRGYLAELDAGAHSPLAAAVLRAERAWRNA